MTIDEKVLNEKIEKKQPLTKDEERAVLEHEGPVEGYMKDDVTDMSPSDFDNEKETDEGDKKDAEVVESVKEEVKKVEDKKVEPVITDHRVDMVKLEAELNKADGKEDLKDFSDREKAYFHRMRKDRRLRQQAESDRDAALFRERNLKKEIETKPKDTEPDVFDELNKKDPTDYLTVAEAKALVEKAKAKTPPKEEQNDQRPVVDPKQQRYLKLCEKEARDAHPEDFDSVMELTSDIIESNSQHLKQVAEAYIAGENPAVKAYELIKADPEFAKLYPVAQTRIEARKDKTKEPEKKEEVKPVKTAAEIAKEKKVSDVEKTMEQNKNKTKTTANIDSSGDATEEASWDEISKMSDREFAKLPRKKRDQYLRRMEDV